MAKKYYIVAEHLFSVDVNDEMFVQMENYEPFAVENVDSISESDVSFSLSIECGTNVEYIEETRQDEEGQIIGN